jgi:hypothetical protein
MRKASRERNVKRKPADRVPRSPRHSRSFGVRFGADSPTFRGTIENLSESGLYLTSSHVFPPQTTLMIELSVDGAPVLIEGVVRWVRRAPRSAARTVPSGMGIRLVSAPAEYQALVLTIDQKRGRPSRSAW